MRSMKMEKNWMDWYKILPPDLVQSAYKSANELAWPKEQALRVVDLLNANGYVILGVDSWLPTKPGPSPLIFDWDVSRHANSDKIPNTPAGFIQQFDTLHPLQEGQEPVFHFCVQ